MTDGVVTVLSAPAKAIGIASSSDAETRDERANQVAAVPISKILDPDDALMARFQNALKEHLLRVNQRINEEILELEYEIKTTERNHTDESLLLYNTQQEIERQRVTITKYQEMLENTAVMREEKQLEVEASKKIYEESRSKAEAFKTEEEDLIREMDKLTSLHSQLNQWKTELNDCMSVSKRLSCKDAAVRRELIKQKQQKDYILYKLDVEILSLTKEINYLESQIDTKRDEIKIIKESLADVDTDFEVLHKNYKVFSDAWNHIVMEIGKKDEHQNQLTAERDKLQEEFHALQREMETTKKEREKAIQLNEHMTSLQQRTEGDLSATVKHIMDNMEKIRNYEVKLGNLMNMKEATERSLNSVTAEYQSYLNEEKEIDKKNEKIAQEKAILENELVEKLKDTIQHNKAVAHLNKLLMENKESMQTQELLAAQMENTYEKQLLEQETLKNALVWTREEFEKLNRRNTEKNEEIEKTEREIKECNILIERKQSKMAQLNATIDKMLLNSEDGVVDPVQIRINTLEKNITETEANSKKTQQFWLRQEHNLLVISKRREEQLREINSVNKQIMLLEHKAAKMDATLEKLEKDEKNISKRMENLQQELAQTGLKLVTQKSAKNELEDENTFTRETYEKMLRDDESEILRLRQEIYSLMNDKENFREELFDAQRESLSWDKKVQLANETAKRFKDEQSAEGDIVTMKSEIHRMEMRLSHLRHVQERLVHDLEMCVTKRDMILNKSLSRAKKNGKHQHNKIVVFRKRVNGQKLRIKQIAKRTREVQNEIKKIEEKHKEISQRMEEKEKTFSSIEESIWNIEKEIVEMKLIKYYLCKS